jgi:predicted AAA+ superfamily ATPase
MAEIELRILNSQCLSRQVATIEELKQETSTWQEHRNNKTGTINWQFTTEEARIKLKRLYTTFLN